MIKMSFIPEKKDKFFKEVSLEFEASGEEHLDDYFEMFKSFCYAMGFRFVEDYEMVKGDEVIYKDDFPETYGEVLDKKTKESFVFLDEKGVGILKKIENKKEVKSV